MNKKLFLIISLITVTHGMYAASASAAEAAASANTTATTSSSTTSASSSVPKASSSQPAAVEDEYGTIVRSENPVGGGSMGPWICYSSNRISVTYFSKSSCYSATQGGHRGAGFQLDHKGIFDELQERWDKQQKFLANAKK